VQEVASRWRNGNRLHAGGASRRARPRPVGPRVSFFFNAHNNLLEEVAEVPRRPWRLWRGIMRERPRCRDGPPPRCSGSTPDRRLDPHRQQPENNVVRVAVQALAAILGGTQSSTRTR